MRGLCCICAEAINGALLSATNPVRTRIVNPRLPFSLSAMMVDWNRSLTRVLILKTGERLRTLHDAAELITRRFGSVMKSAPPL